MFAFVVFVLVFQYYAKRLARRWPVRYQVGCKTLTQSIKNERKWLDEEMRELKNLHVHDRKFVEKIYHILQLHKEYAVDHSKCRKLIL